MVTGPMRIVLWILGSLGVLWALLWLFAFASMSMGGGGMMGGDGMGGDGMMQNGAGPDMMGEMSIQAGAMIGGMVAQTLGMLGLIGVFVYLVVDSLRHRQ